MKIFITLAMGLIMVSNLAGAVSTCQVVGKSGQEARSNKGEYQGSASDYYIITMNPSRQKGECLISGDKVVFSAKGFALRNSDCGNKITKIRKYTPPKEVVYVETTPPAPAVSPLMEGVAAGLLASNRQVLKPQRLGGTVSTDQRIGAFFGMLGQWGRAGLQRPNRTLISQVGGGAVANAVSRSRSNSTSTSTSTAQTGPISLHPGDVNVGVDVDVSPGDIIITPGDRGPVGPGGPPGDDNLGPNDPPVDPGDDNLNPIITPVYPGGN